MLTIKEISGKLKGKLNMLSSEYDLTRLSLTESRGERIRAQNKIIRRKQRAFRAVLLRYNDNFKLEMSP